MEWGYRIEYASVSVKSVMGEGRSVEQRPASPKWHDAEIVWAIQLASAYAVSGGCGGGGVAGVPGATGGAGGSAVMDGGAAVGGAAGGRAVIGGGAAAGGAASGRAGGSSGAMPSTRARVVSTIRR